MVMEVTEPENISIAISEMKP